MVLFSSLVIWELNKIIILICLMNICALIRGLCLSSINKILILNECNYNNSDFCMSIIKCVNWKRGQ